MGLINITINFYDIDYLVQNHLSTYTIYIHVHLHTGNIRYTLYMPHIHPSHTTLYTSIAISHSSLATKK